jgi:hypothetical protein
MKRKKTMKRPDGTMIVIEEHDEAPAMTKAQMARAGQGGDTRLAHVNPWEEALLKKLGGVGTRNPRTGLKQFYSGLWTTPDATDSSLAKNTINGPTANPYGDLLSSTGQGMNEMDPNTTFTAPTGGVETVDWSKVSPTNPTGDLLSSTGQGMNENPVANTPVATTEQPSASTPEAQPAPLVATAQQNNSTIPNTNASRGTGGDWAQAQSDFDAYWKSSAPGSVINWAGGTLTRNSDGTATFMGPDTGQATTRETMTFDPSTDLAQIAFRLPSVRNSWGEKYGIGVAPRPGTNDDWYMPARAVTNAGGPAYGTTPETGSQNGVPIGGVSGGPVATSINGPSSNPAPTPYQIGGGTGGNPNIDPTTGKPTTIGGYVYPTTGNYISTGGGQQQPIQGYYPNGTPIYYEYGAGQPNMPQMQWGQPTQVPQTSGNGDFFDIPLNLMPISGSENQSGGQNNAYNYGQNNSQNTGFNSSYNTGNTGSFNQGSNTSQNNASNYSGLPKEVQDALLSAIIPQLTDATKNMSGNYDKYTNEALSSYQQMMEQALKKQLPAAIGGLANRGIIDSTAGTKALSDVMSNAAISAGDKGYQTAMQQALLKANMPTVLGQLAQLGQTSYGQSAGTSSGNTLGSSYGTNVGQSIGTQQGTSTGVNYGGSQGNNWSLGNSYSQDPTTMYRTMADLLKSMM